MKKQFVGVKPHFKNVSTKQGVKKVLISGTIRNNAPNPFKKR